MKEKLYDCTIKEGYTAYKAICEERHKSDSFEQLEIANFAIESEIQYKPNGIIDCLIQIVAFPISIIVTLLAAVWGVTGGFVNSIFSSLMSTNDFNSATHEVQTQIVDAANDSFRMVTDSTIENFLGMYIVVIIICVILLILKSHDNNKKYKLSTMRSLELKVVNHKILEIENQIVYANKLKRTSIVKVSKVIH